MYSQANVRVESVLRPPTRALPSVIVDTEKVLREADGSVKLVVVRPHTDGKVFAPGCASKPDDESREEPEEHKRGWSLEKYACQQEEERKGDISTVLIFQEQLFTSALFKDTQDVVSLILHYRTM